MRIRLSDLAPGVNYALQLRATDGGRVSDWSRIFNLLTVADTTPPKVPASVVGTMTGTSFNLSWAQVIESADNTPAMDLDHYEVLVSSGGTGTTKVYNTADTKFQFTFEMNREVFGTPRANIIMQVLARDKTGNASAYSAAVNQTNPAPATVTGLAGVASVDTITLKWNANTDTDLYGYQVWRSKTGAAGTYTQLWAGPGTQYVDSTIDYFTDHWYRVYAVDVFGTLSTTAAQTGAALRPNGSFTLDSTPPAVPAGLAVNLTTEADGKTGKAVVTWTAVTDTDGDLSEYIIDYKPSAETNWNTVKVDYEKTAVTIPGLLPYTTYNFRIRSSDWSANLSAWSTTVNGTGATNTAPATVTGVTLQAANNGLTAAWNANTELDVANGAGQYRVEFATNVGFTTGLLTYRTGATNITVTGLAGSTAYWVRVKAVDSLGAESAAYSTAATTTLGAPPSTFKYWPPSGTAPTGATSGDLWFDTTAGLEKQYNGSTWVATGNASMSYVDTNTANLVKSYVTEYALGASETVAPVSGWSTTAPTRTPGNFIWVRTTVTKQDNTSSTTTPALMTGNTGTPGTAGAPAPDITLTGTTQVLTQPAAGGATTPTTSTVTGVATNTTITGWTYSVDSAAFSATVPAGVSRTGNVVTITGSTMTARTIAVKMNDAAGYSDTFTVARTIDGAAGTPGGAGTAGADGYTVLLTNESQTFAAGLTNANAATATSNVIAYKGNVQQSVTVGAITGGATGISAAVTNNPGTSPLITFTVLTTLTQANGTFTIPVAISGGPTINQVFTWSLAFSGAAGTPGGPGATGVSVTSITPYFRTVTPIGAAAPAIPTTNPPAAPWTATEPAYVANTELYRSDRVVYSDATFAYTAVTKVSAFTAAVNAMATADGKNKIIRSTSDASGTTGYVAGDLWWKLDGSGNVIKQWKYTGSIWTVEVLMDGVFGSLSANKLVAGSAFVTDLDIGVGGVIKSAGYTAGGTTGFSLNTAGLTIKGTNNVVDVAAVSAGTITAKTWNLSTGGVINVDATGIIKSNNYSGTSTGWQLGNAGLIINEGDVDAKTLRAGSAIIGDITVGRTADALGEIKSFGYVPNSTGFRLHKTGLEINSGVIKASAIQLQNGHNMMPPQYADFEYDSYYYMHPFWNPLGMGQVANNGLVTAANTSSKVFGTQSLTIYTFSTASGNIRLAPDNTIYNIPVDPSTQYYFSIYTRNYAATAETWTLSIIGNNAATIATQTYSMGAGEPGFTRRGFAVTIPASGVTSVVVEISTAGVTNNKGMAIDGVQFEPVVGGLVAASPWKPPSSTTIDGMGVTTGYIRATSYINVAGTDLPTWSLNKNGSMQVGDALIRGKLVVGTTSEAPVNRAPGGGDFEANATGYQVYQIGATTPAIARTTTGPIAGTGSLSVTAAAGTKTRLGASFNTSMTYQPGTRITMTFDVKVDATNAGSTIRVIAFDSGINVIDFQDLVTDPVAGTVYSLTYNTVVEPGASVAALAIAHSGAALSTTQVMIDNIVQYDNVFVGNSYVSSPDYSPGASGWRIFGDGSTEFNNGIFRGQLGANMVSAEQLTSEIVMSSKFKTASTGRRVEFDGTGISLYEADNSLLVNLPTDTDGPASFNGDLLATSLTISDQMAIRGTNNELSKGATITLSSGTTEPTSPPTVQVGYEQIDIGTDTVYAPYRFGLGYSTLNGGRFISIQSIYNSNAIMAFYNPANGVQDWTTILLKDIRDWGSVTVLGGEIYVLGKDINGVWKVEVRNESTKAWVRTWSVGNTYSYRAAIGHDGTSILIIYGQNSDHSVRMTKFNKTTGAVVSSWNSTYIMTGGNYHISSAGYTAAGVSGGFSVATYWWSRDGLKSVYAFDSAFKAQSSTTSEGFTSPGFVRGAAFGDIGAGNQFFTYDNTSGKITKHSTATWVGGSADLSKWWVGTTWYDPDGTGGTHETKIGKMTSFTMIKRAALTITAPTLPVRPVPNTTDDVRQAGIYMARRSATPTSAMMERQSYTANESRVLYLHRNGGLNTVLPVAGAAATSPPPTLNGFLGLAGVAPAEIRSNDDRIQLYGDGTFSLGDMKLDSSTYSGGLYVVTSQRQYTISFSTGWAAYSATWPTARAFRTPDGSWVFTGMIMRTGTAVSVTSGTTVGTIPTYTSAKSQIGPRAATDNASALLCWQVTAAGLLQIRTTTSGAVSIATGDWISLGGLVVHEAAS